MYIRCPKQHDISNRQTFKNGPARTAGLSSPCYMDPPCRPAIRSGGKRQEWVGCPEGLHDSCIDRAMLEPEACSLQSSWGMKLSIASLQLRQVILSAAAATTGAQFPCTHQAFSAHSYIYCLHLCWNAECPWLLLQPSPPCHPNTQPSCQEWCT